MLAILMIGLSGCFLKSVHPLITAEKAILVEELDGVYETDDQRWTFASDKNPELVADLIRKYPDEFFTKTKRLKMLSRFFLWGL